jgi:hypothetical protein
MFPYSPSSLAARALPGREIPAPRHEGYEKCGLACAPAAQGAGNGPELAGGDEGEPPGVPGGTRPRGGMSFAVGRQTAPARESEGFQSGALATTATAGLPKPPGMGLGRHCPATGTARKGNRGLHRRCVRSPPPWRKMGGVLFHRAMLSAAPFATFFTTAILSARGLVTLRCRLLACRWLDALRCRLLACRRLHTLRCRWLDALRCRLLACRRLDALRCRWLDALRCWLLACRRLHTLRCRWLDALRCWLLACRRLHTLRCRWLDALRCWLLACRRLDALRCRRLDALRCRLLAWRRLDALRCRLLAWRRLHTLRCRWLDALRCRLLAWRRLHTLRCRRLDALRCRLLACWRLHVCGPCGIPLGGIGTRRRRSGTFWSPGRAARLTAHTAQLPRRRAGHRRRGSARCPGIRTATVGFRTRSPFTTGDGRSGALHIHAPVRCLGIPAHTTFGSLTLVAEVSHFAGLVGDPFTRGLVHIVEPLPACCSSVAGVLVDRSGKRPSRFTVFRTALHGGPSAWRALAFPVAEKIVAASVIALPVAVVAVAPAVVGENRVVTTARVVIVIAGIIAACPVIRRVIVTEVVVTVARAQEQVIREYREADHQPRRVAISSDGVNRAMKIHGREYHAAAGNRVVPVTIHEDVATRRPTVSRWHMDPVHACRRPIAGAPDIVVSLIEPSARQPGVIRAGSGDAGPGLNAARRCGQVGHLGERGVRPIAGDPLETVAGDGIPITGKPLPAGRQVPPDSADPEKRALFLVPGPVARNPDHILALRLVLGRQLFNRSGRGGIDDDAGFRIKSHDACEGLVHGTPGEEFITVIGNGRSLTRAEKPAGQGECGDSAKCRKRLVIHDSLICVQMGRRVSRAVDSIQSHRQDFPAPQG